MSALEVRLGETRVGWLEQLDEFHTQFSFDPDWLGDPRRPILGALFEDRRPQDIVFGSVPPCWFHHLLPQGPLRRMLARRAEIDPDDSMALLELCGADLPGAVVLTPAPSRIVHPTQQKLDLQPPSTDTLQIGYSVAGNQWKLSVRYDERGLVILVWGQGGEWIAKFHDPNYPRIPQLEYATTRLADRCGLSVPEIRLVDVEAFDELPEGVPVGDGTVFLTKRFDRMDGGGRIHMEDFAQILDRPNIYAGSYAELAAVLHHLRPDDVDRLLLQLVFCLLLGNGDAHLKNWSVTYPGGRQPLLSPAYDLVPTIVCVANEDLALTLGHTRSFDAISLSSFDKIATACGRPAQDLREQVHGFAARIRDQWRASAEGFNKHERERIDAHLEACWRRLDATPA